MSPKPIRKAVFPVAGLGTRFLPATKVVPKELLPVVDRPLIQYAVDEAREAGIEQMIFVTGRGKTGIVEHFDIAFELEQTLAERGKDASVLDCTRATPGDVIAVRQQVPLGLGHAGIMFELKCSEAAGLVAAKADKRYERADILPPVCEKPGLCCRVKIIPLNANGGCALGRHGLNSGGGPLSPRSSAERCRSRGHQRSIRGAPHAPD